ncbi:butyrophilin subfamily 1 member A1-like [Orycteropus afer afer]|uniref:Butyrophilin subfamily 1 member A1-like n=1 Tax=Orycteropus afer afer TaxID=1230840 RepID=A0AC54ZEU0_ORYAF|nr:butyrophilin subfamily 1 member A1-like [Orycteropus afer afer]
MPAAGQFHVTGPRAPVTALVREEAVFSCHLSPPMDAQNMDVRWYHDSTLSLVHHYMNSQDQLEQQNPEYRGRTEFLRENITKGQVTLRIHHIRPSDEGDYRCLFISSTYYSEAQFQVLVTASGTGPHIHIELGETRGIKLTCTSTGWYPEPEVKWRDLQRKHLAPSSETKIAKENGLFHVETSITVDEGSRGSVSCLIRNPFLSVEKEAHISVSDALFPRNNPWIVGLAVFLVLVLILFTITSAFLKLTRKAKDKISKELEDIILDRDTAHPYLEVSDDGKSVTSVEAKKDLPDNPERFDTMPAVLGKNTFCGGNHYWEVRVEGKNRWTIGLCSTSVIKKGQFISASPDNGFWTLCLKNDVYQVLSTPRYTLDVKEPMLIVGIFLDYERELITFYNATEFANLPFLYSFKFTPTESLQPYFYPGPLNERNSNGLTIL